MVSETPTNHTNTMATINVFRKGQPHSVESSYTNVTALIRLFELVGYDNVSRQFNPSAPLARSEFAVSLAKQQLAAEQGLKGARGLSLPQLSWVHVLVVEAEARIAEPKATPTESFAGIRALFTQASTGLKNPKVRFATEDGTAIVLNLAGKLSKAPGTIHVTGEGSFETRAYFGKIDLAGTWHAGRNVGTAALAPQVLTALRSLDADPAGAAAAYGRRTGSCCFCCRELTDGRSVSVGYGPICAERFGLPWGE